MNYSQMTRGINKSKDKPNPYSGLFVFTDPKKDKQGLKHLLNITEASIERLELGEKDSYLLEQKRLMRQAILNRLQEYKG